MKRLLVVSMVLALAGAAQAQPKAEAKAGARPDFSGTWVMDPDKSDPADLEARAAPAVARTRPS
jgi:hypothetical protein